MGFKDVSELHLYSLEEGDPAIFETVLNAAVINGRRGSTITSPHPHPQGGDGCGGNQGKLVWFSEMPKPEPQRFIADPAIPKAFPMVLHGQGGSAKSLQVLDFCLRYTNVGGDWLGNALAPPGKALVVDFELNQHVFASRVLKLAKGMGLEQRDIRNLGYYEVADTPTPKAFADILTLCQEHGIDVVVIDSVGLALQGDAASGQDVIRFYRDYITPLTALGITPILIDHQARSYGDEDYQSRGVYGSSYKENLARSVFQVQPRPSEEGSHTLVVRMRQKKANFTKLAKPFDVHIRFQEDRITLSRQDVDDAELLTENTVSLPARILAALAKHETGTVSDITGWVGGNQGSVGNAVRELRRENRVVEVGKQGNATVYGLPETEKAEEETPQTTPPHPHAHSEYGYGGVVETALVETDEDLGDLIEKMADGEKVALDLETMPPPGWGWTVVRNYRRWRKGLKHKPKPERMREQWNKLKGKEYKRLAVAPRTAEIRLVSVATPGGSNAVVDASRVDITPLLVALQGRTLLAHNASFDLGVLRERFGYVHRGRIVDTQDLFVMLHYAGDGNRSKLQDGKRRLPDPYKTDTKLSDGRKVKMVSLAAVVDRYLQATLNKAEQASDWSVPNLTSEQITYALNDSTIMLDLEAVLVERLEGLGMSRILELETRTTPATVDMERNGFPASRDTALKMAEKYRLEHESALRRLEGLLPAPEHPSGVPWRWTDPKHIRAVLQLLGADLVQLDVTEKTGEPSTSKGSLRKLTGPPKAVEWIEAYLDADALRKRATDFVTKYGDMVEEDGTIKGAFKRTSTGRFLCQRPNLQQVPQRGELQSKEGLRIRDIFRPKEGDVFIVADFGQVELLIAATIAREEAMLEVFRTGGDIHRETASWVLDKPQQEITKEERTLAKALIFGLLYGCKAEKLVESAGRDYGVKLNLKQAKAYRRKFFERYAKLEEWQQGIDRACKAGEEYAITPLGRRRKLPYWESSNTPASTTAKNSPVQGAGADAIRLTMAKLFEDRASCPGNPQLNCTVHDEVVLSVEAKHRDAAIEWVRHHMAQAEREAVGDPESPIVVDVEARESWGG
jgi:DNA polymerase I